MALTKQSINPWKGLKGLPHNMWMIFAATLINRSGTMVLPFLAIYMTKQMNISEAYAGLMVASYGAGALVTAPFVGKIADKVGALRVMKFSLTITGLILFVYSLITNFYLLLAFTFLWAIINESFRPANMSLISEVVETKQRRTAFALNRLAINLGMSIGPAVGGLLTLINFSIIFYVDGFTSICAAIFLAIVRWDKIEEKGNSDASVHTTEEKHLGVLKDKRLLFFMLAMTPILLIYFQHLSAMPLFLVHDLNLSPAVYGALTLINTGLIIFFEVPLNNYLVEWSDRKNLALGAILTGIGFGAMAFATGILFLIITIIIWTVGEMIAFPASAAYVSEIAPVKKRGEYMGFFQMTFSFSFMAGPWLGTLVLENFGSFTLWIGAFVLGLFSTLMMLKLKEKPTPVKDK